METVKIENIVIRSDPTFFFFYRAALKRTTDKSRRQKIIYHGIYVPLIVSVCSIFP